MNAAPPAHSFIWRRDRSEVNALSVGAGIGGSEASGIVLEAIVPVWEESGGLLEDGFGQSGIVSWAFGRMNAGRRN